MSPFASCSVGSSSILEVWNWKECPRSTPISFPTVQSFDDRKLLAPFPPTSLSRSFSIIPHLFEPQLDASVLKEEESSDFDTSSGECLSLGNAIMAQELSFDREELSQGTCASSWGEGKRFLVSPPQELLLKEVSGKSLSGDDLDTASSDLSLSGTSPTLSSSFINCFEDDVSPRNAFLCPEFHSNFDLSCEEEGEFSRNSSFQSVSVMLESFGRSPSQYLSLEDFL